MRPIVAAAILPLLLAACESEPTRSAPENLSGVYTFSERINTTGGRTCVSTGTMALREERGVLTGEVRSEGQCTSSAGTDPIGSRALLAGSVSRGSGATAFEFKLGGCPYEGTVTGTSPRMRLAGTMTCAINVLAQGTWSAER